MKPRTLLLSSLPALVGAFVIACAGTSNTVSGPGPVDPPEGALRVLFIGNSLTYVNDLPAVAGALADSLGVHRPFWYQTAALPDYALEDHWADGRALNLLRSRSWDVVVLQQGPSSLPENQISLREWTVRFATEIRNANGQPALYMVWPESTRRSAFDAVMTSYTAAADAVNGILFPVGRAWLQAWSRDANLPLYGPDGFHPSGLGTYLAALVIVDRLYETDISHAPIRIRSRSGTTFTTTAAALEILVTAAREANRDWGR